MHCIIKGHVEIWLHAVGWSPHCNGIQAADAETRIKAEQRIGLNTWRAKNTFCAAPQAFEGSKYLCSSGLRNAVANQTQGIWNVGTQLGQPCS